MKDEGDFQRSGMHEGVKPARGFLYSSGPKPSQARTGLAIGRVSQAA